MNRKVTRGIGTVMVVIALVGVVVFSFSLMQIEAQADQAREIALEKAIETAKLYGMETEQPDAFIMKQTTLAEWITLTRARPGMAAVPVPSGRNAEQPIWIVSMVISGTYTSPGWPASSGPRPKIDNITVAIAADTYQEIGVHMVDVNRPLPLGLERLD
jgi:hypothetical protein